MNIIKTILKLFIMKNKSKKLSKLNFNKKVISNFKPINGGNGNSDRPFTQPCLTIDDICADLSFNPNCRSLITCPQR